VLSSHILGDIDRVCDRLLVLNQGQMLFDGERNRLENLLPNRVLELRVDGRADRFRAELRARTVPSMNYLLSSVIRSGRAKFSRCWMTGCCSINSKPKGVRRTRFGLRLGEFMRWAVSPEESS
jgi:hypothetical protein